MKIKIIVSLSIFLLMFSVAWVLERSNHLDFYDNVTSPNEEDIQIAPLTYQGQGQSSPPIRYEVFKSREYVRIQGL